MARSHTSKITLPLQETGSQRHGPFEIVQVLSPLTYRLRLPSAWKIHNVFHASLLSPYCSTEPYGPSFSSPPPDVIDNEEEYKVEAILSHKGPNARRLYLTTWKGYPSSENTWEPKINLHHSPSLLKRYKLEHRLR